MRVVATLCLILLGAARCFAGSEMVSVVKVLDNDDKFIIERRNGEQWLMEKGVGALSMWRYEGKQVIIYSGGMFGGVGSKVILPDVQQEARIWDAKEIGSGARMPAAVAATPVGASGKPEVQDAETAMIALVYLGYVDPKKNPDWAAGMKRFQQENGLPMTGHVSMETQMKLSEAVRNKGAVNEAQLKLARDLLNSAQRMLHAKARALEGRGAVAGGVAGEELSVDSVSGSGEIVTMMDGSIFEIDILGQVDSMLWLPTDRVLVVPGGLLHLDDGDRVGAKRIR